MKAENYIHQMIFQSPIYHEICGYEADHCPCPEECDLCAEASFRSAELNAKVMKESVR